MNSGATAEQTPCMAFGADAAGWAGLLPADLSVLVVDMADDAAVERAYAEALRRRMLACPFYVATILPLLEDRLMRRVAFSVAGRSFSDRCEIFDGFAAGSLDLDGKSMRTMLSYGKSNVLRARGLQYLADAVLTRSPAEYEFNARLIDYWRRSFASLPVKPRWFDGLLSARDGSIVVWAPELTWQEATMYVTAVEELRAPISFVLKARPSHPTPFPCFVREEALSVLARAIVIVDTTANDPSPGLALAELGVPLVASRYSGIDLYLDNVTTCTPWGWRDVQHAIFNALATRAPVPRRHAYDLASVHETLAATAPILPKERPLVSIVTSTYNRPEMLERMLRAFAQQTYDNIECIIVNDAGCSVEDVVSRFPMARLIDLPENTNDCGATPMRVGSEAARGKYVGFMADDDLCYPDHIARLVEVLERSGSGLVHANMGIRFLTHQDDKELTIGYTAYGSVHYMDPEAMLTSSSATLMSMLVRRELLAKVGYYPKDLWAIADLDLMLRLSKECDGAHVDRITTEWRVKVDGSNTSMRLHDAVAEQFPQMWERFPCFDRPAVRGKRAKMLEDVRKREPGKFYDEPAIDLSRVAVADFGA